MIPRLTATLLEFNSAASGRSAVPPWKGRHLNSLALQRQAGSPPPPIRPEGAVPFHRPWFIGRVGFRPFRAGGIGGTPTWRWSARLFKCRPFRARRSSGFWDL